MAGEEDDDNNSWVIELEAALLEECTPSEVWTMAQGRSIPDTLRPEVWQACLGVQRKESPLLHFSEIYDLPEQSALRSDCQQAVCNEDEDKVSVISDFESILTCYCKSTKSKYEKGNGWIEILLPLLSLKLPRAETYNLFDSILHQYIPRGCIKNGLPFQLFHLLLQYHDPELCSFLDTKRVSPDLYCLPWFQSLFSSNCHLPALLAMWDHYFQLADPFFVFYLALVMLVNAREQILSMKDDTKAIVVDALSMMPCDIVAEDTSDFCTLAQYYATKTPSSFRAELIDAFFGPEPPIPNEKLGIAQALCLPVSAHDLVFNPELPEGDAVKFFLVDCRPAEQYNAGHLPTAFHLDCNLMLQEPANFATAVQGLLAVQQQALASNSVAGGDHLCFLGSGREEEDQYTHMVVASFLQKHTTYVSMVAGGYSAIHELVEENPVIKLEDHNPQICVGCLKENSFQVQSNSMQTSTSSYEIFGKLSAAMKSKSAEVKEKLFEYIVNPTGSNGQTADRHVRSSDKVSKRYRNMAPVFSIDDDDAATYSNPPHLLRNYASSLHSLEDEADQEVVSIQTWLKKPDVVKSFKCHEVKMNGYMYESYLIVTSSHIYVLREIQGKKGLANIAVRRPVSSIVRITSKKKHPDLITFKYGISEGDKPVISDMDRFLIPEAAEATKVISQQIMKQLNASSALPK
ncbi:TBC1 domain family member 23 isoform X2 [Cloeon dipterum]|uniref:TBC1 domain family member 23 isoform X2 n=1 Tax=Cloeon dipterum TaxID=197152 RepID=UPI00321F7F7A